MTLPIPEWPRRDPQWRGAYDYTIPQESVTIGAGGYTDVEIDAGVINFIYRLRLTPTNPVGYSAAIYSRNAREDDDLMWRLASRITAYNSLDEGSGLILALNKDQVADSAMHFRIFGTPAEVVAVDADLVRLI